MRIWSQDRIDAVAQRPEDRVGALDVCVLASTQSRFPVCVKNHPTQHFSNRELMVLILSAFVLTKASMATHSIKLDLVPNFDYDS